MSPSNGPSSGPLVLIVEDNDKNMKLVRDILRFKGYRTLEATSGREGVRLALAERPDLVLMDVQLPDIDGVAALQELRADPAAAEMTVVALTAFAMKSDRERFMSAGFDGYITKPISVREFPDQVRQYCERGRAG
jgi:two-component system cell cycle response regulator DivK